MGKQYPIGRARDRLPAIVHEVERGSAVELTRRGKPVAVMVSVQDYQRLSSGRPDFWGALEAFRRSVDLRELDIQPGTFDAVRETSPGRELSWRVRATCPTPPSSPSHCVPHQTN